LLFSQFLLFWRFLFFSCFTFVFHFRFRSSRASKEKKSKWMEMQCVRTLVVVCFPELQQGVRFCWRVWFCVLKKVLQWFWDGFPSSNMCLIFVVDVIFQRN
jgi:hypothetical protein